MESSEKIKAMVREKYGKIAKSAKEDSSCCGESPQETSCCGGEEVYTVFSDSYEHLEGYVADADLGLGCGLPTEFAGIKKGHTVIDLGSGAGNDVFVARREVGESGKVIGLDMTDEMLEKAVANNRKLGYENVEFIKGEIENIPLLESSVDVVISNCVLNLVPDKNKAFAETKRILKSGGHFCVSDIVLSGELPDALRNAAAMYAGCVAGALQKEDYLAVIEDNSFEEIKVVKQKEINLPDSLLREYLTESELKAFRNKEIGIFSITVVGFKK